MKIYSQSEQFDTLKAMAASGRPNPEYHDGSDEYMESAAEAEDASDRAAETNDPEDHTSASNLHDTAKTMAPGWDASLYHSNMIDYHHKHGLK